MWRDVGRHITYTSSQRRVLTVLLGIAIAYVAIRTLLHRATIDDPPAPIGDRATEVADRLDPNTADAAELGALPSIGEKRARAIVARRETVKIRDPFATAFKRPQDLLYVDGFGTAMVEQIKPYLIFPATQPTTGRAP